MNEKLNILNFVIDEKFIDLVIRNHDSVVSNVEHFYVLVLGKNISKEEFCFRYISNVQRITLLYSYEVLDFIKKESINSIILHSLYSIHISLIPKIPTDIPILWVAWGYDIYQSQIGKPLIEIKNLYLPATNKAYSKSLKKNWGKIKYYIANVISHLSRQGVVLPHVRQVKRAIRRINFFSGIIDMEYQLMKKNSDFHAEESVYVYGPIEFNAELSHPKGYNVQLGNSGAPTNNHIDLFNILYNKGIDDVNIVTPLSYGCNKHYIQAVQEDGRRYFGPEFNALTGFLDRNEYSKIVNSCNSLIVGVKRQQAMGNIGMAFENGMKVFLFKDSILYRYFKNKGYKIFTIDDDLTKEAVSTTLSEDDAIYNFKLHKEYLSKRWNSEALKTIYTQFRKYISQNSVL